MLKWKCLCNTYFTAIKKVLKVYGTDSLGIHKIQSLIETKAT